MDTSFDRAAKPGYVQDKLYYAIYDKIFDEETCPYDSDFDILNAYVEAAKKGSIKSMIAAAKMYSGVPHHLEDSDLCVEPEQQSIEEAKKWILRSFNTFDCAYDGVYLLSCCEKLGMQNPDIVRMASTVITRIFTAPDPEDCIKNALEDLGKFMKRNSHYFAGLNLLQTPDSVFVSTATADDAPNSNKFGFSPS